VSRSTAAIRALSVYLLTAAVFVPSARAGTAQVNTAEVNRLFVVNPNAAAVTAYPIGKFGNITNLVTDLGMASPNAIARDATGNPRANYDSAMSRRRASPATDPTR
jgi:hypothetical protein